MSSDRRKPYPFDQIEPKWQAIWEERQLFHAPNPAEKGFDPAKPKFYVLDMFPYPSGAGLHVGPPEGYTATDIVARYKRLCGFSVLHPMGWDAFGLPAEQYAIKTGQHPAVTTRENVAKFKSQLKRIGFSYDWQREINTTDPKYYKWTQWIFLQIYNSWFNPETNRAEPISTYGGTDPDSVRLAYVADVPVNWCPELGTVLANEEVIDGKSEVGGFPVVRKPMRQWMLRITAYAERLLNDLAKEKTGVWTGAFAINPVNNERIPIWIADYVLATYGTGAIMAVPAHDERDLAFARKFNLPIRVVVQAPEGH